MILLLSCVIPKEVTGISFPGTAILLVSTNHDKILEESEKKENHIWLVEKTCPSYESYFANQKNCEDIDWNLTVHLSNLRVEMMRKKSLFWCEITKHATMAFWMAFFESRSISFLKIASESFRFANSCAVRLQKQQFIPPKQFTSSWLTNVSVAEFWINRGYYVAWRR